MKFSLVGLFPRRFINSPHDAYKKLPNDHKWWKRQRYFRFNAWTYTERRWTAKQCVVYAEKMFMWETEKRRDKRNYEHYTALERLKAALREYRIEYKHFMPMIRNAKIDLSPIMLAQLAIYEPRSFESLVMTAKQLALEDGRRVVTDPSPECVVTRGALSDGPSAPRAVHLHRGRARSFTDPPRELQPHEF